MYGNDHQLHSFGQHDYAFLSCLLFNRNNDNSSKPWATQDVYSTVTLISLICYV